MTEAVSRRFDSFEFGSADQQVEKVRVYGFHGMVCDSAELHIYNRGWEILGWVECSHKTPRRGRLGRLADLFLGVETEHGIVTIENMSRLSVQGPEIGLQDYRI